MWNNTETVYMMNETRNGSVWHSEPTTSLRTATITFYSVILFLGVVGNVMVLIVILKRRQMRNSTNIFLVNLGIADLMLLLLYTPSELIEIIYHLRTVVTGVGMCLSFRFLKQTSIHASVLTILALSFERYYAICKPLKASYICTNKRAVVICAFVWFFAGLFASPILAIFNFEQRTKEDGTVMSYCVTHLGIFWNDAFFVMTTVVFFAIPLIILIIIYGLITKNLIVNSSMIDQNTKNTSNYANAMRYRRQVVLMLATVVLSFFVCFLPREILMVSKILFPKDILNVLGTEGRSRLRYAAKVMRLLHSTMNPIFYNLMSSQFRGEFAKLLGISKLMRCCRKSRDQENMQSQITLNTIL